MKYKEYQKKLQHHYKMNRRCNKVIRPCIGIYCRGEKNFKSFNGARICPTCSKAIEGMGSYEPQRVYFC